jgi:ferric-dicitrate binding protein FerR (iron transport regulator)
MTDLFCSLQLLKLGFVDKNNFDAEDRDRYERERRGNSVVKEKQELEARQREENAKAYEEWSAQKEMRDQALKCLALIPKPVAEVPAAHDDPRGSSTAVRRSQQQSTTLGRCTLWCMCAWRWSRPPAI